MPAGSAHSIKRLLLAGALAGAAAALRLLPQKQRPLGTIVFIRHGHTAWDENQFIGWADPDISPRGAKQATSAALALKESGFTFDVVYTSLLKRAVHTTWLVLRELEQVR
jgi:2,3-bisphosphoglycerate-dependent phosphoglycerate mutase